MRLKVIILLVLLVTCKADYAQTYIKAESKVLDRTLSSSPDWGKSPYSGWTREHWIEVAGKLTVGFVQHMDPETGMPTGFYKEMPRVPYLIEGQHNRRQEMRWGFTRGMMFSAAYCKASGKTTFPGYPQDLAKPFIETIIRATDPESEHFWKERFSHSGLGYNMVWALTVCPEVFWDPLTEKQKKNLARWFLQLVNAKSYDNNHYLFHMTPVRFLEETGTKYNRAMLERYYERLFGFYRGDGWYVDGDNQGFDWYNAWAWQQYNLFFYHTDSRWRAQYGERIKNYAGKFLSSWPLFFGAGGAPVAWGRSLHYRFAYLSPLGWAQLTGLNPLSPGLSRRLASGMMKYFWDHGAMSNNGILEPGYWGKNFAVPENYGWRGQPSWASVGLVILAIPPEDPFWSAREEPLPVETGSTVQVIRGAQMVVRTDSAAGESRVYKIGDPFDHRGRWQRAAKYFGHAYSSKLGFILTGEGSPELVANTSAASADGISWSFRDNPRPRKISDFENVSEYRLKEEVTEIAGTVITHTFIGSRGEVHVIYHTADKPLYLSTGGYGIQVKEGETVGSLEGDNTLTVQTGTFSSTVMVLGGVPGSLEMRVVEPRPGFGHSHLFGGRGAFPAWTSSEPVPRCHPVVLYVNAAEGTPPLEECSLRMSGPDQLKLDFKGRETFLTTLNNYWAE